MKATGVITAAVRPPKRTKENAVKEYSDGQANNNRFQELHVLSCFCCGFAIHKGFENSRIDMEWLFGQ